MGRIAGIIQKTKLNVFSSAPKKSRFSAKMGVNQSKGSVNITSTPNKGPAPAVAENGKKVEEKIITDEKITDDTTKINGDVEKVTNGDAKKEEVVEEDAKPETAEGETEETVEEADGDKTTSEKKKTSTKDKIK